MTRFTPLLKAQAAWRLGPAFRGIYAPEDIVAEAWLVALRRLGDLVQGASHSTARLLRFLGTTVLHITNRRIEESIRRGGTIATKPSRSDTQPDLQEYADTVTGAVTQAARNEMAIAFEAALATLSASDREVILLRVAEGLSNQEAARHLGEPLNTVSQRYRRAMMRLREALPGSFLSDLEPD